MSYVLGLTGGIATGKSHLSRTLAELGAVIVDADRISHGVTARGGAALRGSGMNSAKSMYGMESWTAGPSARWYSAIPTPSGA